MPVVINEFEAVAEAPAQRDGARDPAKDAAGSRPPSKLEPAALRTLLLRIEARSRRLWPH